MSSEGVKFLLSSDAWDEEYMPKYSDCDTSNKDSLHQIAIRELQRTAKEDNVNEFIQLCKNLKRLKIIKNVEVPKSEKVLNDTNLVITACKYNSLSIIKELFKNENWDLARGLGIDMRPEDRDSKQRDAFFYAMKTGNLELLRTLVEDWPGCHFSHEADQLEELLSENYERLRLCGLPMGEDLRSFIEEMLIRLRFFSDCQSDEEGAKVETSEVVQRIQLLREQVCFLNEEFGSHREVDGLFLFVGKSIAHNIHILKQRLQSTYDKLPWEEIEFCLVSLILTYIKEHKNNIYVNITLNKTKVINYLNSFVEKLNEEKDIIESKTVNDLIILPKLNRSDVVKRIQLGSPKFEDLYNDFKTIRDMDSLMKINEYIEVVERADVETKQGQLEVIRGLQVMGEHLKSTLASPKMSEDTSREVTDAMSPEARKAVLEARDFLSHSARPQVSVRSLSLLQDEITHLGYFTRKVLCGKKFSIVRMLLHKIVRSDNIDEMRKTCLGLTQIWDDEINFIQLHKQELQMLKKLVGSISDNLSEKTERENEFYSTLSEKIEKYIKFLDTTKSYFDLNISIGYIDCTHQVDIDFKKSIGIFDCSRHLDIEKERIKYLCKYYLEINADNPYLCAFKILNLRDFKNMIASHDRLRFEEIERLNMFLAMVVPNNSKFYKNIVNTFKKIVSQPKKVKKVMKNQLTITPNISELNSTLYLFDSDMSKKDKLSDIEMCCIEILSKKRHIFCENNINYLDGASPILIGKNLRNQLAHDNLIAHLSADPIMSLKLNVKVIQELEFPVKRKIGRIVRENINELRERYENLLKDVTNVELAIKEVKTGNISEFLGLIKNGVDVSARSYDSRGFLHWAAMCGSPDMVRTLLEMRAEVEAEDGAGQRALHLAAARGEATIAGLLLAAGAEVAALDRLGRSPLHLAADSGCLRTVRLLLRRGAESGLVCSSQHTPLVHALLSNKLEVFHLLRESDEAFNVDRSYGAFSLLQWATICGQAEIIDAIMSFSPNINSSGGQPIIMAAHYNREKLVQVLTEMGSDVNVCCKGMTPLVGAIISGNASIVDILLEKKADVNDISSIVGTPLHAAVISSQDHIVEILLKGGANPNKPMSGRTPLHDAIQKKSDTNFKALLNYGANINSRDNDGCTPLYLAVSFDFGSVIPDILKISEDVNIPNNEGVTPLHCACKNGNYDLVNTLIQNGANINQRDIIGHSILLYAVIGGNKEIISLLLKKEADITGNDGWTDPFLQAIIQQRDDIINIFLKHNVNISKTHLLLADKVEILETIMSQPLENALIEVVLINALYHGYNENLVETLLETLLVKNYYPDNKGSVLVLCLGCRNNYPKAVNALLKKGVKVNDRDEMGRSPLHYAAMGGHERIVKTLLSYQADVNATDEDGVTALYYSARYGRKEVVNILIQNKAELNIAPNYSLSPLYTSLLSGHYAIATSLIDIDSEYSQELLTPEHVKELLFHAILSNELEIVQLLISKFYKSKINDEHAAGNTLAHYSAIKSCTEIIKYLLRQGANFQCFNNSGDKPIHISAKQASYENLIFFCNIGFDLQDTNQHGQNLLHCVLSVSSEVINYNGPERLKIIRFLIGKGMNVNEQDSTGSTPLHLAAENGTVEIVRFLLERGANLDVKDDLGRKPVDRAKNQDIKNEIISTR